MGKLAGKSCRHHRGDRRDWVGSAKLFVKEGAYVFITGRRQKELDGAVKAIGSNVTGFEC